MSVRRAEWAARWGYWTSGEWWEPTLSDVRRCTCLHRHHGSYVKEYGIRKMRVLNACPAAGCPCVDFTHLESFTHPERENAGEGGDR